MFAVNLGFFTTMAEAANETTVVTPGQRLAAVSDYAAGTGTYVRDGFLFASVVGVTQTMPAADDGRPVLIVEPEKERSIVPQLNNVVTGKITKVNPRMAYVSILVVESQPCKEPFRGIIRVQDVRATEKDLVQINKSFRPGDIVLAEVISLGDARSYYLSTARNDLGVIFAESEAGATMFPISWQEMMCPKTKVKEFRKCAKPMQ